MSALFADVARKMKTHTPSNSFLGIISKTSVKFCKEYTGLDGGARGRVGEWETRLHGGHGECCRRGSVSPLLPLAPRLSPPHVSQRQSNRNIRPVSRDVIVT